MPAFHLWSVMCGTQLWVNGLSWDGPVWLIGCSQSRNWLTNPLSEPLTIRSRCRIVLCWWFGWLVAFISCFSWLLVDSLHSHGMLVSVSECRFIVQSKNHWSGDTFSANLLLHGWCFANAGMVGCMSGTVLWNFCTVCDRIDTGWWQTGKEAGVHVRLGARATDAGLCLW